MRIAFASLLALACSVAWSQGAVTFTVSFDDPGGQLAAYQDRLQSHLRAAGRAWGSRLDGDTTLTIRVRPTTAISLSSGYSYTTSYVGTVHGVDVFEQGAAAHLRTGTNVSPGNPDIEFIINVSYLTSELWFDPSPDQRTAFIDPNAPNATDAMSVCLHELGHALAYNGWMNGFDGSLPGYMSPFDQNVAFDGNNFFFTGPAAQSLYEGPVPVTFGNPFHLANASPRPGSNLINHLMNGVVFTDGQRYAISELDWAILADIGVRVLARCAGDLNGDRLVDDADFVLFAQAYNVLICGEQGMPPGCPSDLNADGLVDDSDFVAFVFAYNELICP